MGRDKAFVEIGGQPMVARVAAALRGAGIDPVAGVGGDGRRLSHLGLGHLPDRWPGEGPLGGLLVALEWSPGSTLVVVGCDMPWLDVATAAALVDALDMAGGAMDAAVAHTGRRQPLCAAWRVAAALTVVRPAFVGGERSVGAVLTRLRVLDVAVDPAVVRDVDWPEDVPDHTPPRSTGPRPARAAPPALRRWRSDR